MPYYSVDLLTYANRRKLLTYKHYLEKQAITKKILILKLNTLKLMELLYMLIPVVAVIIVLLYVVLVIFDNLNDSPILINSLTRKGEHKDRLRLLIATWYDKDISEYADITFRINSMYGLYHNIDVVCSSKKRSNRGPSWERVWLLLTHLHRYDYVIWCDADACFKSTAPDVRHLLQASNYPDVVLSSDKTRPHNTPTWFATQCGPVPESEGRKANLNAGIFIVKNSKAGQRFLERWSNPALYNMYKDDQCVLQYMYMSYLKGNEPNLGHIVKIPYGELQMIVNDNIWKDLRSKYCSDTPYVYHMAGQADKKKRSALFADIENLTNTC